MTIEIQFLEGIKEEVLPIVKLTKSKNGKTGTATFVFINPISLKKMNSENYPINGMYLISNNKKIVTQDIHVIFREGKPFVLKAILIFKNSKEWFDFLYFMNYYSQETGLSFAEKTSSF
jgi:photosystem II protein